MPIAGKIGHRQPHPLAQQVGQPLLARDLGKRAVAVVVVELHRLGVVFVRMAIRARLRLQPAADGVGPRRPVAVIRNEQVQPPVVVVVDPASRHRPHRPAQRTGPEESRLPRHIRKRAVPVVAIQVVSMHPYHKQILMAVVVAVAHGHAHPVAFALQPRLRRHVAECSVAVVPVEPVPVIGAALGQLRH